jgi:Galactose oxidase, central domain/Kelch motif
MDPMKYRRLACLIAVVALAGTACGGASIATPTATATTPTTAAPTATPPAAPPAATPSPTATPQVGLKGPLGDGRQIQTATLLADGGVLVAGGFTSGDGPLASATRYDPGTGVFNPTGSMANARGSHTATLLPDGHVLIAGGGPASWTGTLPTFLAAAELYDPKTGTFAATGPLSTPRESHTATLLSDGRVLITGGEDRVDHAVASAEIYDPRTGTFSATGSMTVARAFHTATLLPDGRALIAGGNAGTWNYDGPFLASAEIYNPKTGGFSPTGSMATPRAWQTATRLADGRVLVAGGENARTDLASAEIYTPKSGKFSPTGSMTVGRVYHAATLLSDGRVLVEGGGSDYSGGKFLASAELYNPKTGTWTATGSMADQRNLMTATLLRDGQVLVAGGFGAQAPLASAELYDPKSGTFSQVGPGG